MPRTISPLSRSGSPASGDTIMPFAEAWRSRWRSDAPTAASAKRLSAAICCSSDQMPANSATAARSAVWRLAMRRRRIKLAASSAELPGVSTAATVSSNSGSAPSATRRVRNRHSLTASPLRKGLLPKIAASRCRPDGSALQPRAACAAGSSAAAASASSQASKPRPSWRESAGSGSPPPSGERWDSSFTSTSKREQHYQSGVP